MSDTNRKLKGLARKHGLTYARIAELAGEGTAIKTVEGWMATPGTVSFRTLPAYRLELIELRIRLKEAKHDA